jgi:hypothetical protein
MARKRYAAEQVITKLRVAEVEFSQGLKTPQVSKELGIADVIYRAPFQATARLRKRPLHYTFRGPAEGPMAISW